MTVFNSPSLSLSFVFIRGPSAFLCSVFLDDLIIAGSYDKRIYAYDPRGETLLAERLSQTIENFMLIFLVQCQSVES